MTLFVNGEKVEEKQIRDEMEQLRPRYEQVFSDMAAEAREKQLYEWSRENVIERVLLGQAAMESGEESDRGQVEQQYNSMVEQNGGKEKLAEKLGGADERQIKEDLEKQIRVQRLVEKIRAGVGKPNEKQIERFYENNIERFTVPEMVRASHIVKYVTPESKEEQLRTEMEQILEKVRTNGKDFARIAGEHSECADSGGDLGYFPRGKMVPEFEEVAFSMQVGEISEVFRTPFGYHIVKLTDRKPASACSLDEVRQVVVRELKEQLEEKAVEKFLDEQKAEAKIAEKEGGREKERC